ncbi:MULTISPECIES: OsmC family protein [Olivibacter]|jgi:putative redox protein|uniref:OsmC family protein n=3 Tax=Sphingobacteriaceae TaxID=84566 RepID=F4C2A2_SPHS2|nr:MULTISPECIES: OsmC family protein [Olivibacter]MDM8175293.1 OsmC family protein [Olivibacter sp. 47]QEL02059.1 OsmC family protein [Olivibacter sp. LS-1]
MAEVNVTVTIGKERYKTEVSNGRNIVIADEPESMGGTDQGLGPKELLLSSLGSCTAITLRMYADRKQWDLQEVIITVKMEVVPSSHQQTTYIKNHIKLVGNLDDDQRQRLLQIAELCPVHKILSNPIVVDSNLVP